MIPTGKAATRELTHARILLKADQGPHGQGWSDARIAEALESRQGTVARVLQRLCHQESAGSNPTDTKQPPSGRHTGSLSHRAGL